MTKLVAPTPVGYALSRTRLRAMKASLTRAIKSGDSRRVLATVARAYATFERLGWPDCWSNWQRARDDAAIALGRRRAGP